jgi:hypothetical protein
MPAALGCTTFNPSVQSCAFRFARWFGFTRGLDLDFCLLAMRFLFRREGTRLGPVANGL